MKSIKSLALIAALSTAQLVGSGYDYQKYNSLHKQFQLVRGRHSFFQWLYVPSNNDRSSIIDPSRYMLFKQRYQILDNVAAILGHTPSDIFYGGNQTKQGMELDLNGLYEKELFTPWGQTCLTQKDPKDKLYHGEDMGNTIFFNMVGLSFLGNTCAGRGVRGYKVKEKGVSFYTTDPKTAERTALSEEDLVKLIGTSAIITSSLNKCSSRYAVTGVGSRSLAEKLEFYEEGEKPLAGLDRDRASQTEDANLFEQALRDIKEIEQPDKVIPSQSVIIHPRPH